MTHPATAAVIGGGPAGLMAAEVLSATGVAVTVYERMPSVGRKFLMAGRGGLNLTHAEPLDAFLNRYGAARDWIGPMVEAYPPAALRAWAEGLGQPVFEGPSRRVFPTAMKASPLLRAWLGRLAGQGVEIHTRRTWRGWDASGALAFDNAPAVRPDVTILALGGASWPRLGADGGWTALLAERGVDIARLRPANSGVDIAWSPVFRDRFAGEPLHNIALTFAGVRSRGEAVVSGYGLEGGAVYAVSAVLREAVGGGGSAVLRLDLRPDMTADQIAARLVRPRGGQSLASFLRKTLKLPPVAVNLLRETHADIPSDPAVLAQAIKAIPLTVTGVQGLARAISTAGGVARGAVDERLQLKAMPGVYVVGEMLDWEAPTGGYLLQVCFASAVWAAKGILQDTARPGEGRDPVISS
jgi:uncharacterized flavoprotein (TIGR03862 family)